MTMAHMNQEIKAKLVVEAKKVLKKYGVKATFSTGRFTIYCNIKSGPIDFISNFKETVSQSPNQMSMLRGIDVKDYLQVNPYHYQNHFTGVAKDFLHELIQALNTGNWDNSDIQTDYFDVGWYINVNVGKWNKPYQYTS
jgi:hypothetical protein